MASNEGEPGRKRIDTGIGGLSDTPENANEEFGRGDQEFGGGKGTSDYGDEPLGVGQEGVVAEGEALGDAAAGATPGEQEGNTLAGSDPDDRISPGAFDEEPVARGGAEEEE